MRGYSVGQGRDALTIRRQPIELLYANKTNVHDSSLHWYPSQVNNVNSQYIVVDRNMAALDVLLQKGPPNGDLGGGLEELRYTVLTDGIASNSDGMV